MVKTFAKRSTKVPRITNILDSSKDDIKWPVNPHVHKSLVSFNKYKSWCPPLKEELNENNENLNQQKSSTQKESEWDIFINSFNDDHLQESEQQEYPLGVDPDPPMNR